ncbi:MAG TPA: recombinase family protein [Streptosporangiaceae bacterium]|nr:recombinase family protein [Streptosporangiaceae bacterium]
MRTDEPHNGFRAAVYCRVSTEEQAAEGTTSIEEQERRCREFAERKGWTVVKVYKDEGVSGTKRERPEWNRLMADAQASTFGVVVVLNWKRFARSARNGLNVSYALEELGVSLGVVEFDVDTTTKEGRLWRTQMLGFAEYDRDMIVEQGALGQRAKVRRGGWSGGGPGYGYKVEGSGRSARLVLDEAEAAMVRLVTSWIVDEGLRRPSAAVRLNQQGYRQRNGNPWHPDTLRDVLANSSLKGEVVWGGSRRASGDWGEPIVVKLEQAVLTPERWAALQEATRSEGRPRLGQRRSYPLGNKRMLSPCGETYGGFTRARTETRIYQCRNHRWTASGEPRCACLLLRADELETRVWSELADLLGEPERLTALVATYLGDPPDVDRPDHLTELANVRREAAKLEAALVTTVTDYAKAGLPADAVRAAVDAIEADLADLRERERTLVTARAQLADHSQRAEAAERVAEQMRRGLAAAADDLAAQTEILRLLAVRVAVLEPTKQPRVRVRGEFPIEHRTEGKTPTGP